MRKLQVPQHWIKHLHDPIYSWLWTSVSFTVLVFINCLHIFFKLYTQIQKLQRKRKMPHISCKMMHDIQNITNTSQEQTFPNTFAMILIPARLLCVTLVVFCKKVFYKFENRVKGWDLWSGFADLASVSVVWVSDFRNCVTSKDLVCKHLK